jgi:hypothetical protein
MALNPFFLQGSVTEQSLVQDLINEQLRMYGVECHYLPRSYVTQKTVMEELTTSRFTNAIPLEAYIETYDGYQGQGELLSKFGIQPMDDLTLIISKERFEQKVQPVIKNDSSGILSTRPKEGDLIHFPLGDRLFEIKFVEHEQPFYQLQKTYTYQLKCELFRYEDEVIDTNINIIDDNIENEGYIQELYLVGVGTTATAVTTLVSGAVQQVFINNDGTGYRLPPNVIIGNPVSGETTASGVAIVSTSGGIEQVQFTNPGAGYTSPPVIMFFPTSTSGGSGAGATCGITTSGVGIVTVTNGGAHYTTTPTITFSNPSAGVGHTIATAVPVMSNGQIQSIRLTNAGYGYTQTPTITISAPGTVGLGTYIFNEEIIGDASSTVARVKSWDAISGIVRVGIVTGDFILGESISGLTSGAEYKLKLQEKDNLVDEYNQNKVIETLSDDILDFTEKNPFGEV